MIKNLINVKLLIKENLINVLDTNWLDNSGSFIFKFIKGLRLSPY